MSIAANTYLSQVNIDCVVFGFENNQLKVLVAKLHFKGDFYALPSGFILEHEDVEDAVKRVLLERTGLSDIYLEQFAVFGNANRYRKEFIDDLIRLNFYEQAIEKANSHDYKWFTQRFVSIGYYALVDINHVTTKLSDIYSSLEWYDISSLPKMIMDYDAILKAALQSLREDINTKYNAFYLLPEKFTMKEVQDIYETILEKPIVRTNFQKKILELQVLERLEKKYTGAKNKAPYLYKFKGR